MGLRGHEESGCARKADEERKLLKDEAFETAHYGAVKDGSEERVTKSGERTPLPLKQLFLITAMLFTEPMAISQIFPYVNRMIVHFGIVDKPSQAGYYSGYLESVFAIAELCTVLLWSRLAERVGRKPVILACLSGLSLTTLLFGVSKSYTWAMLMRGIAGSLSGNKPILQNILGDITDDTNRVQAYGIFQGSMNVAEIVGPAIGGTFAEPAITFPRTFGRVPLFVHFPYFLPCLICALGMAAIVLLGALNMKKENRHANRRDSTQDHAHRRGILEVAAFPPLRSVLINYFLVTVMENAVYSIFSLYAYAPITAGGLSRNPEEIGAVLAFCGTWGAVSQIVALPYLQRRLGLIRLFRLSVCLIPVILAAFPLVNILARYTIEYGDYNPNEGVDISDGGYKNPPAGIVVWIGMCFIVFINRMIHMSYSLFAMFIRDASPSPQALGAAYSVAHLVHCVGLTIAPGSMSTLFSFSADTGWMGGCFVWVVMLCASVGVINSAFHMRLC